MVFDLGNTQIYGRLSVGGSILNKAFSSESFASEIRLSQVIEYFTGSDHQYINFKLVDAINIGQNPKERPWRCNSKKLHKERFEGVTRLAGHIRKIRDTKQQRLWLIYKQG